MQQDSWDFLWIYNQRDARTTASNMTVPARQTQCYVICATPRCGSSLLCETLAETGLAGYPGELASKAWRRMDGWSSRENLFETKDQRTTPNGVFGVKLMWSQFDETHKCFASHPDFAGLAMDQLFQKLLPGIKYIWIRRRDKEAQAVSLAIAQQTGLWTSKHTGKDDFEPNFDFYQIHDLCMLLGYQEDQWQKYFDTHGIEPLVVTYEDYTGNVSATIEKILDHLQIAHDGDLKIVEAPLRQLGTDRNRQWAQRYKELRESEQYRGHDSAFAALRLFEQQRPEEALAMLEKTPRESPQYYFTKVLRGIIRMTTGDHAGSERELNEAIEINPDGEAAYVHRARLRGQQGRPAEGLQDLELAEARMQESDTEDDTDLLIREIRPELLKQQNRS